MRTTPHCLWGLWGGGVTINLSLTVAVAFPVSTPLVLCARSFPLLGHYPLGLEGSGQGLVRSTNSYSATGALCAYFRAFEVALKTGRHFFP